MDKKSSKIKKISLLILGVVVVLVLFLDRDFSDFNKATLIETGFIKGEIKEEVIEGIVKEDNQSSDEESGVVITEPEIKEDESVKEEYPDVSDRKDQLVHHLFNINHVPSPKGAAFTPDGKEIWITLLLNKSRGVSIFSALDGKKIEDIYLAGSGGVEVIFSSDGKKAYISQMETAKIFEINTETKQVLRVFNTESTWTKVLALSKDEKTLFASNWSGNDVSEIDLEEGKLRRRIPTVKTPRGIYPTGDGNFLYVAGFDKGEIEKIDLRTGIGRVVYTSGGAMRHIVADEDKGILYFSEMAQGVILRLFLEDDRVEKFVHTDYNPNTLVLSPDKKILFVSCRGRNHPSGNYYIPGPEWGSVLLFDTETGEMLDAIVAGNQPTALDISPDGRLLVFSDFLDARLEVYEIPSYQVLKEGGGGRSAVYKKELMK